MSKRERSYLDKKAIYPKNFKGNCRNCEKVGHKVVDCCSSKRQKNRNQANKIEKNEEVENLCAMLTQYNLVGNPKEL